MQFSTPIVHSLKAAGGDRIGIGTESIFEFPDLCRCQGAAGRTPTLSGHDEWLRCVGPDSGEAVLPTVPFVIHPSHTSRRSIAQFNPVSLRHDDIAVIAK